MNDHINDRDIRFSDLNIPNLKEIVKKYKLNIEIPSEGNEGVNHDTKKIEFLVHHFKYIKKVQT